MEQNKIPKKLLSLLNRRKNTADKLMVLDAEVENFLTTLGVAETLEYYKFQNDYGCMLYTEPSNYLKMTIDILEKNLNIKKQEL